MTLSEATDEPELAFSGVVLEARGVDIAPMIAGRLKSLEVELGDIVAPGQRLATLDRATARENLRMASAKLELLVAKRVASSVELSDAKRRIDEERALGAEGISPTTAVQAARADLEKAGAANRQTIAAVAQQRAAVDQQRRMLTETRVRAPVSGRISQVYARRGSAVGPAAPILRLTAEEALRVRFAVPPEVVAELALGDPMQVDGPSGRSTAKVVRIATELDAAAELVFVDALLDPDPARQHQLRPGLGVGVRRI